MSLTIVKNSSNRTLRPLLRKECNRIGNIKMVGSIRHSTRLKNGISGTTQFDKGVSIAHIENPKHPPIWLVGPLPSIAFCKGNVIMLYFQDKVISYNRIGNIEIAICKVWIADLNTLKMGFPLSMPGPFASAIGASALMPMPEMDRSNIMRLPSEITIAANKNHLSIAFGISATISELLTIKSLIRLNNTTSNQRRHHSNSP